MNLTTMFTPEEEGQFTDLIDEMAGIALEGSLNAIKDIEQNSGKLPDLDDLDVTDSINMAIGQVAIDKVIELSKDWPKELMIRFIANLASSQAIQMMNKQPDYIMKVAIMNMIKKQRK